ncbi:NAD(P)-dependent dehydrogenase (short-subunit alcohol dehydrogenase family) [Mesonia hippocampi]|uniref:NAD(P)-dependent dehydrogenase (Short-subunit alcohol dehydrogenase family) n=1 Tax=Mesonia hippocampi TaxID=1628250 RepID=A0A840F137_9FLAO|nr:SDR family oxidoreductase [Mesonia hippocampi]MBB4119974.1 NAD(P)-dependent dehydrogenase (short-subunit alcohol dehydrogenase family) [Mesonia hippocampi]
MTIKNIIISGASRGIGFELAKQLCAENHQVIALSRNITPLQALALPNLHPICFDLQDQDAYKGLVAYLTEKQLSVDVLINNAGKIINKPFEDLGLQDWQEVYATNVFGVAELTKSVLPFMNKEGHVVTVSSMGGVQGSMKFPGLAAYSSSKGAVITLTELLAEEYKETGPAFNVLALGAVQTEMLNEAFPGYKAPVSAAEMASYIKHFAMTGQQFYNGKLLQVANTTP